MNLRSVDLNLLTVVHALLEEAHVSRAAHRLGMSQPATSSALERARHVFGDPLLERVGSTMRLTRRAEVLRQPLADVIAEIGRLVAARAPSLGELRQTIHVVMADTLAASLTPALHDALRDEAPGLDLVIHAWIGDRSIGHELARGQIDLAVAPSGERIEGDLRSEPVTRSPYAAVMRRDHPAAGHLDLNELLAWPHIVVSATGESRTIVDDLLSRKGLGRRIGMVVPSFLLVPRVLASSDMIALLPPPALGSLEETGLVAVPPPLNLEPVTLSMTWHRRRDQDPAVQFVLATLRTLLRDPRRVAGEPIVPSESSS